MSVCEIIYSEEGSLGPEVQALDHGGFISRSSKITSPTVSKLLIQKLETAMVTNEKSAQKMRTGNDLASTPFPFIIFFVVA